MQPDPSDRRAPTPTTAAPAGRSALIDAFFARIAQLPRRVLMLDYDGTLAPFHADRFLAQPYAGVRELLTRIRAQAQTRLLIVSGRPAREAADMLALAPAPEVWGGHGWERLCDGELARSPVPAAARSALERLLALRPQLEAAGALVEEKYASVALHTRGLAAPALAAVDALLARHAGTLAGSPQADAVYLQAFEGGVELRARGRDKGSVVRDVLAQEATGVAVAYLGDDLTDEDAFAALAPIGAAGLALRVLTGDEPAPPRATAARGLLRAPTELLRWLQRWADLPPLPPPG